MHIKYQLKVSFGQPPKYNHLKVFGYLCYALLHSIIKDKFDPYFIKYIFVGYLHGQKRYRVYDLSSKQIFIFKNIIFYKTIFLFAIIGSKESTITKNHGMLSSHLFLNDDEDSYDQSIG